MIGRTNAVCVTSGGSSGGVTTVDLPTHPASISTSGSNAKATVNLTYTDTDYISGVEVRYKTGGYPTSPTDGNGVTAEGAAASIEISGLTNGTKYYFRAYLFREVDGVKYYQTDDTNATVTATPSSVAVEIEGITPAEVGENYIVIAESGQFTLHSGETSLNVFLVSAGGVGGAGFDKTNEENGRAEGGRGGNGGKVLSSALSEISETLVFTAAIGDKSGYTTLSADGISLTTKSASSVAGGIGASGSYGRDANKGTDGVLTPYGYVGSSGGGGGYTTAKNVYYPAVGGNGAGDGGAQEGSNAINYGCGGGGGGYNSKTTTSYDGGAGMQGCIIISWD